MELNTKIIQLLRKHTGGEAFFDTLNPMKVNYPFAKDK